jgi:hypothetical protein
MFYVKGNTNGWHQYPRFRMGEYALRIWGNAAVVGVDRALGLDPGPVDFEHLSTAIDDLNI